MDTGLCLFIRTTLYICHCGFSWIASGSALLIGVLCGRLSSVAMRMGSAWDVVSWLGPGTQNNNPPSRPANETAAWKICVIDDWTTKVLGCGSVIARNKK
jgi:hypothetical protein